MAFSNLLYKEPPEVRYFYHEGDREKVESICDAIRKEYGFLDIEPGGDIFNLNARRFPKNREYIRLLFLSKEHSLIFRKIYETGREIRVCMLDDLINDVSALVDDRKHLVDASNMSKGTSVQDLAFLIVKALIPDDTVLAKRILKDIVYQINVRLVPEKIMMSSETILEKNQFCSDLLAVVKSDKILGPIFMA